MIAGLPEPARRYFRFAIAPGTPLRTVAVIEMTGRFGLGDKADHRFQPMRARQILAPSYSSVWIPRIGSGLMRMSGSDVLVDGAAWTRFWLLTNPTAGQCVRHVRHCSLCGRPRHQRGALGTGGAAVR